MHRHNGPMDDVTLRPIREEDLEQLSRFVTKPEMGSEFEWIGFRDPKAARRRWEEDGWLGSDHAELAVDRGGVFAGIVSWKDRSQGFGKQQRFEVGSALWPEHRGQGVGTEAQRQLVEYLFQNTPAHRLEAYTEVTNRAEQRALEKVGFEREGVIRKGFFRAGEWRDSVMYGLLRDASG